MIRSFSMSVTAAVAAAGFLILTAPASAAEQDDELEAVRETVSGIFEEINPEHIQPSQRSPNRNSFQPGLNRDTYDGELGWRQRVATGGLFENSFTFSNLDQDTLSVGNFPSQISTGMSVSYTQPWINC